MSGTAMVLALDSPEFPPHLMQQAIGLAADARGNLGHEIQGEARRALFGPGIRRGQIVVALLNGEIVGMASFKWRGPGPVVPRFSDFVGTLGAAGPIHWLLFNFIQMRTGRDGLYIVGIDVFDGYHRRGVGAALLNGLIRIAHELGADSIEADVRAGNDGAHAFFRALGFAPAQYPLCSLGRLIAATNGRYRRVCLPFAARAA